MWLKDLLVILLAYLLGSIPFAHIITRWRTGKKVREVGDGNAGARNVWHVVGPIWGFLVAMLDIGKGLGTVLLARLLGVSIAVEFIVGPAAILGHAFSPFLRFRGGKGLAALAGVLLAWTPWSTLAGMGILFTTQMFLRNFDRSIVFGATAGIFLPPAFGYPWTMSLYSLGLFLMLAAFKLLDLSHERRVWVSSGWKDVDHSDWYSEPPEASEETPVAPKAENGHL